MSDHRHEWIPAGLRVPKFEVCQRCGIVRELRAAPPAGRKG
jgi:hypothetical protein